MWTKMQQEHDSVPYSSGGHIMTTHVWWGGQMVSLRFREKVPSMGAPASIVSLPQVMTAHGEAGCGLVPDDRGAALIWQSFGGRADICLHAMCWTGRSQRDLKVMQKQRVC